MNAQKRVLVSGAGGFIGRWSVAALLTEGYEVHAVLSGHGVQAAIPQLAGAFVHHADLLDAGTTSRLLNAVRPSHLLHFAWVATPGVYWTSPDNLRWLDAGRLLIRAFRDSGGERLVAAGTCAEYDWSAAGLCSELITPLAAQHDEKTPLYARCKIALQRELDDLARAGGMSSAWGRVFFQYGPAEHPDRLAASVIRNLLAGREAACTHGRQIRSFLHVSDVGRAFAALLGSRVQGPVNIGGAEPTTIGELLAEIASQMQRPQLLKLGAREAPPGEPPRLVPDVHRLYEDLRFRPHFDLRSGIADTIDWWRARSMSDARTIR